MRNLRFAAALIVLVLAACQGAAQVPTAAAAASTNAPALTPPDSVGILVLPVTGAPPAAAANIAAAMVKALQEADVPASAVSSNQRSFRLSSHATAVPAADGSEAVTVAWTLNDADGKKIGAAESEAAVSAESWNQGGGGIAEALTQNAAPAILKLVEGSAPLPQGNASPVVALGAVSGAPGDGDTALARAMGAALKRVNVTLAGDPGSGKADYTLACAVEVSPPDGRNQKVKLSWALLRPDGSEVGRVNQENAVPAGSLDRAWGDTAYAVTSAAAPGVRQLIEQAGTAGGAS